MQAYFLLRFSLIDSLKFVFKLTFRLFKKNFNTTQIQNCLSELARPQDDVMVGNKFIKTMAPLLHNTYVHIWV